MPEIKPTKEKKLRVFWNSNAMFSNSGYGQQMQELLPHIQQGGYPTAICNFFGQQGTKFMLNGIVQYPIINHTYGSDAMVLHARDFQADVTFTLQDTWVLHPQDLQQTTRWIPWLPIDHDPIPKAVLERMRLAHKIIAMSKFGQKQLQDNGLYSTYIPHSVDVDIFKPMDKAERKRKAGLSPDTYVLGMVAANKDNPPRKSFQEVLDAFKLFLENVPNSVLYIHTNPQFPGGFPIHEYAEFIGIKDKLLFPDSYQMNFNTGKEEMALIYNTFDCFVLPSVSEGFGIPVIEAQSCGIPTIVNNWTAQPELIVPGETGEVCDITHKRFTGMGSYIGIPSVDSIFANMMKIYKADRVKMSKAARRHIEENYSTKKIFREKWKPLLERLEKEVYKD